MTPLTKRIHLELTSREYKLLLLCYSRTIALDNGQPEVDKVLTRAALDIMRVSYEETRALALQLVTAYAE